jgi:Domain of unknown function (DUF1906)
MAFGIDYSFGSGLSVAQMRAAGVTFVCRYLDYLPNAKVIDRTEFANITGGGLHVVLNWEGTGKDCVRGEAGGVADATEANRQAVALGASGCPIYFSPADYDVPPGDQAMINAYMKGVASVISHSRTGMYGGYWPLSRAFDAGVITWGWQTYAWSGGNWDSRAHIQQYQNDARLGPASVDYDRSMHPDFGAWPRPAAPAPAVAHAAAAPAAAPAPKGPPYRHVADGSMSLAQIAASRNTTPEHLWVTTVRAVTGADVGAIAGLKLPRGFVWYSDPNP